MRAVFASGAHCASDRGLPTLDLAFDASALQEGPLGIELRTSCEVRSVSCPLHPSAGCRRLIFDDEAEEMEEHLRDPRVHGVRA